MSIININLNNLEINLIDLSHLTPFTQFHSNKQYFDLDSGVEHYKILTYLTKFMTCNTFIDIGTYLGFSALALSHDDNKHVITYDIFDSIPDNATTSTIKQKQNITCKLMNCIDDIDVVINTQFICLDIGHDGHDEAEILQQLQLKGYKGIVFMDDIHLNDEMKKLWESIQLTKIDVTKYGHWSGSGIVIFDDTKFAINV